MTAGSGLRAGSDGRPRCFWAAGDPGCERYHDREWGRPTAAERALFEKLCLEGFQAGLSWRLVLARRDALRRAFADFDFEQLARWPEERVADLLTQPGMIRHPGKIAAVLENARIARRIRDETGSFAAFLWSFAPRHGEPAPAGARAFAARRQSPQSQRLARALRARGWRFLGPVSAYAFMQAVGFVNDHLEGCILRAEVEALRRRFFRDHETLLRGSWDTRQSR